eukprot:1010591-Amphidinium_carterae.1
MSPATPKMCVYSCDRNHYKLQSNFVDMLDHAGNEDSSRRKNCFVVPSKERHYVHHETLDELRQKSLQ